MNAAYIGNELELFAHAHNWKRYFAAQIPVRRAGSVLEVGAGLGGTTRVLCDGSQGRWVALEPDADLRRRIADDVRAGDLPANVEPRGGTLADVPADELFDAILYVDVLEHIEDDAAEAARAARHLAPGGKLVILSPAHPWLYTPFDRAIGHFRRYTKDSLERAVPRDLVCERLDYLDSVGMLASLANRALLRASMPTLGQIGVWDRMMVPVSERLDGVLGHRVGKSVLGIWSRR